MTFQEFFLKKKIDLEALQTDKPDLFIEFQEHYSLMGSKSFDHTKKYWFNNLRQAFPLSDEKENELKKAFKPNEIPISEILIKSEETAKETKPAMGFKPRFKAPLGAKLEDETTAETPSAIATKPQGFKPPFNAGATKSIEEKEIVIQKENQTIPNPQENFTKPTGFKPRFKAGVKKSNEADKNVEDKNIETSDIENVNPKPLGFKPRFKK